MATREHDKLSRREREIMNILYRLEQGTAADVHERLSGEPSYSTVRAQLRILEEKGLITHQENGPRYVFRPVLPREDAGRNRVVRHTGNTGHDSSEAASVPHRPGRSPDSDMDVRRHLVHRASTAVCWKTEVESDHCA